MRKAPVWLLLGTAAALIIAVPANAEVKPGLVDRYQSVYEKVAKVNAGPYHGVAGRNIGEDGVLTKHGVRPATSAELKDGIGVMHRMIHPPKPPPIPAATSVPESVAPAPAAAPSSVPSTSSGGCPSYMAGEASSPSAVNPSSGASGCYQVLPSTAAAMGSACADVNASSCVAAICASSGNGAWASSGATPCDYISQP